ncbi:MAG: hypothetical protein L0H79_01055 [Intrasporangium sp.]|uniref:hypothetical protein n=1 Tax=Intrasporangium sp. TaxID=1925024 RepID=UPI00264972F6|nr:hypothetical protein [Intrasporangium sp.]MDN5794322.1 hypothetical protein [Intrasporangium sp.]
MSKSRNRTAKRNATRKPPPQPVAAESARTASAGSFTDLLTHQAHDLAAGATVALMAEVAQARTPLAAELVLCNALGAMRLAAPENAREPQRLEAERALVTQLIDHAESLGDAEALALLRVCSFLGQASTRAAAAHAAARLAQRGVADRPWAARVGRPKLLMAWESGNTLGAQISIGALFDYQGREHALMVLIDFFAGGGIKDCWVAEGHRRARHARGHFESMAAGSEDAYVIDLDADTLVTRLRTALAAPPRPMADDQIEDVARYLPLTRARMEWLATGVELAR